MPSDESFENEISHLTTELKRALEEVKALQGAQEAADARQRELEVRLAKAEQEPKDALLGIRTSQAQALANYIMAQPGVSEATQLLGLLQTLAPPEAPAQPPAPGPGTGA